MLFDPLTIAMVVAYFLVRRGGENAMWLARKDGTDPPSYRRWQERQKRRGQGGSVAGRAEARKFWAHLWHDAHASAHEWRQRRYGRRWEDRHKRWQAEDVQRQQNQPLAPCVFCGAGRGAECAPDCPEVLGHRANRDSVDRATVPPQRGVAEPATGTEPSQPSPTEPTAPSHPDGTVLGGTEPTEPAPSHLGDPDRATPEPATEPSHPANTEPPTDGIVHDSDHYVITPDGREAQFNGSFPGPSFSSYEEVAAWAKEARCEHCGAKPDLKGIDGNGRYRCDVFHAAGCPRADQPLAVPDDLARKRAEKASAGTTPNTGGNVTTSNATGEIQGYEATLAEMDQTIAHLEATHSDTERRVAEHEQLDGVYENRINALRQANADEETIDTQVRAREANETQISAAKAALEAASVHMEAEHAARDRWIKGQGAMKETADAVGARGDQVLRD